jgi:chromosome partitioning protein
MTASVIVVGNEKGGAGKSTIAIHLATALLHAGATVAVIDLDLRQKSVARFFDNRRAWIAANDAPQLPQPIVVPLSENDKALAKAEPAEGLALFAAAYAKALEEVDFILIDTPGGDTPLSKAAHGKADLIVTPMNDSFVDFDLLGQVDPVTMELIRPSIYAETVWESRKAKMSAERRSIDWIVLKNRLGTTEARNRRRLDERLITLSRRVGFRLGTGFARSRHLSGAFPLRLTVADLSTYVRPVEVSLSHVAARQELRQLMQELGLEEVAETPQPEAAAAAEPPAPEPAMPEQKVA